MPTDGCWSSTARSGGWLRQEPDGTLMTLADLTGFGAAPVNELLVDAAGNAYVNGTRV